MESLKTAPALPPLQLAYIGDAVYALLVRRLLVEKGGRLKDIHSRCTALVRASAQAEMLDRIAPLLTEEETQIVRKGRNAHAKHAAPRSATATEYAYSTAFEALIGYLHLEGREDRMLELLLPLIQNRTEG